MRQSILTGILGISMVEALSDMFAAAQDSQIEWQGEPVYAIYEIEPAPEQIIVDFVACKWHPVQGIALKAVGAVFVINDVVSSEMVLWTDTAPKHLCVQVRQKAGKKAIVKVWNVWRGKVGNVETTQAWLGNAGMRVRPEASSNALSIACSDGEGSVDFGDLQVNLDFS